MSSEARDEQPSLINPWKAKIANAQPAQDRSPDGRVIARGVSRIYRPEKKCEIADALTLPPECPSCFFFLPKGT